MLVLLIKKYVLSLLKEWVPTIAFAIIIALVVNTYVAQAMTVPTDPCCQLFNYKTS